MLKTHSSELNRTHINLKKITKTRACAVMNSEHESLKCIKDTLF